MLFTSFADKLKINSNLSCEFSFFRSLSFTPIKNSTQLCWVNDSQDPLFNVMYFRPFMNLKILYELKIYQHGAMEEA